MHVLTVIEVAIVLVGADGGFWPAQILAEIFRTLGSFAVQLGLPLRETTFAYIGPRGLFLGAQFSFLIIG